MVAISSGSGTIDFIKSKRKDMSKVSNLFLDIQEDILFGNLAFAEIAAKHEVPISWVAEVYCEIVEQECLLLPEPSLQECLDFDMGKEMAKEE
jgi:hypothetical protein